ncbi:putative fatty-acid--CoA ligase [Sterolibacterium denitrificans]|uniref:Fatty-acid--CoA ligase n=2 Tax=Sterolibacterium denitrificans TaxID=157592 RepID=A0A7Z7HPM7_9PROT|nr:FadD3 family acyl-CoA ligase [Sterolibacterium denitrificans]KYC28964.1 fatty acid--CoA ligase [Sterolibacterium denitrificans]SMB23084.1 putative fatty-acid--CoA ligase [Sterolibacterium denitrificans]
MSPLPQTIPGLIEAAARNHPQRIAIREAGVELSFAGLDALRLQAARALMSAGIQAGDRVAVWAPNCHEWVAAALGIHSVGAILIPINTRMKGVEAADILEQSGARLLFCVGEFLNDYFPAMLQGQKLPQLERIVVLGKSRGSDTTWQDFLTLADETPEATARERAAAVKPEDLSDIMFTSGTTGRPKGVMTCHGQNIRAFDEWARCVDLQADDRYLIINPFFHSFGYKAGWLAALMRGCTIYPLAVFDTDGVLALIGRERISFLPGSPTLFLSFLAHPKLKDFDLSSLRVAVTGAAAIAPSMIHRMRDELGFKIVVTAYGLTECCGVATICDRDADAETIATTSGRALPGIELRCVDEEGKDVPAGGEGEVVMRGYNVMQGYFNHPEATAETIKDGWLHTGDIGILDANGNLKITDRMKDMYIVGGFNCYPAEVERILTAHPAIAQVAVIGVPDARQGEVGKAYVVLRPDATLDAAGLIAWARDNMANYKVPRHVEIVAALPMNASGKVLKYQLR